MKAIILAAGVGKRIGAATGNRPKCLLEFGGRSLLVRYLDALLAVGVQSAVLVVGHRQELIRDAIGEGVGYIKINREDARAMLAAMEPFVQKGELDMEYEDTWEAFFRAVPVGCEKIGGQPWIEIDFPEDIVRAEREVLPRLQETL